jgi:hypothetical protein
MRWLSRGFRVRTLLILIMLVGVLLGGSRMAMRTYRANMYGRQALEAAYSRDRHRQNAVMYRLRDDTVAAEKQDKLAEYSEDWRRVLEHAASSGEMVYASSGPQPIP